MTKKFFTHISAAALLIGFICIAGTTNAAAQHGVDTDVRKELRPFDFNDKYYVENGVRAETLFDRVNGFDGRSVFGFNRDPRFNSVRIISTRPAYGPGGEILFWNRHGGVFKYGFTADGAGTAARMTGERYPIYVFPSTTMKGSERQSALMEIDGEYFEKNPLGIGIIVEVAYTRGINTEKGREIAEQLAKRNGLSADGTPLIKSLKDLNYLVRYEMVSLTVQGQSGGEPSFYIGTVIQNVDDGAISPDAFLNVVTTEKGKTLPGEVMFEEAFRCAKNADGDCGL